MKDLIKKFGLSNFWKEIKLQQLITNKYFDSVFPICSLLIAFVGLFIIKY